MLEAVALHYLERFAASCESLRRVLMRRVDASAREHGTDREEDTALVEALIARYRESGLLDDRAYAETRGTSLRRRGDSAFKVRGKLRAKGVDGDIIESVLATEDDNAELAAAVALARKRRLGPFGRSEDSGLPSDGREQERRKRSRDLATLARAGYASGVARLVVDAETVEDLERLLEKSPADW